MPFDEDHNSDGDLMLIADSNSDENENENKDKPDKKRQMNEQMNEKTVRISRLTRNVVIILSS